jgi:RNA polymerase sigma-70 factor (ECF subfamily)
VEFDEGTMAVQLGASDEGVVIDEMNLCMREVIDSLPEEDRAALVPHDLEGLSEREFAAAVACTPASAKIRVHRARRRLEEALRGEGDSCCDEQAVLRCEREPQAARWPE